MLSQKGRVKKSASACTWCRRVSRRCLALEFHLSLGSFRKLKDLPYKCFLGGVCSDHIPSFYERSCLLSEEMHCGHGQDKNMAGRSFGCSASSTILLPSVTLECLASFELARAADSLQMTVSTCGRPGIQEMRPCVSCFFGDCRYL